MHRSLLACFVVLALVPRADAGTPLWAVTHPNEPGTQTLLDSTRGGTVVATIGGSTLVASNDFGMTWRPGNPLAAPPSGGSSQTRVALLSGTRWIAENGDAVSVSPDAGATWHAVSIPPVIKDPRERWEWATEVGAADGTAAAVVGWEGARVRGLCPWALTFTPVFTTSDAGTHWRRSDLPVAGYVWSAHWLDARHAAVSVVELSWSEPKGDDKSCESKGTWVANSVWTTADGGAHWRRAIRTGEWYVDAAWASPSTLVMVGESNGVGRSYVSLDAGRTFRRPVSVYTNAGAFNGFPAVGFADARRGWVSAVLSGVYRTDSGGTEWTHETSPADGAFYGVGDLTVMDHEHAVSATPQALVSRYGEVGPVPSTSAGAPYLPQSYVESLTRGALRYDLTLPAFGPPSARLLVSR